MLGNEMFKFPEGVVSRWASYENPDGAKGAGGKERNGRALFVVSGLRSTIRLRRL